MAVLSSQAAAMAAFYASGKNPPGHVTQCI